METETQQIQMVHTTEIIIHRAGKPDMAINAEEWNKKPWLALIFNIEQFFRRQFRSKNK